MLCNIQTLERNGEQRAADKLLDVVSTKLVGDNTSAFKRLVYSLVQTDQLQCATMLDEELTEKYIQDLMMNNSRYG